MEQPDHGAADRVREARAAAGLTQEQLAREIGVSAMVVSRWERGITRPSRENLRRLHVWAPATFGDPRVEARAPRAAREVGR